MQIAKRTALTRPPVLEENGGQQKGCVSVHRSLHTVSIAGRDTTSCGSQCVLCTVRCRVSLVNAPISNGRSPVTRLLRGGGPALLNSLVCSGWHSLCVCALLSESTKTVDGRLGSHSGGRGQHVRASSDLPVRGLALPDAVATLLTLSFPLKGLTYLALWVISNFLTTFLMEAP